MPGRAPREHQKHTTDEPRSPSRATFEGQPRQRLSPYEARLHAERSDAFDTIGVWVEDQHIALTGSGPADPLTYAGMTLFVLAAASLACLVPARQASRVEPSRVLRGE